MKKDGVREATYDFYMTGQSPMSPRTDIDDQKDAFPHIALNSMLALKCSL